ncbi:hypothetical protein EJ03DRAFT_144931 [Teratosphaeria nubilosa]|uniref:Uncharacterized protein n=1 Tax=Teratosphaeria nubilosa TaxID=161662 RepID=A0A6G1L3W2_9PEZI|nr:hypothetical protein EJ03DRAFT_144931 [Teratosphaeria nubilosa]
MCLACGRLLHCQLLGDGHTYWEVCTAMRDGVGGWMRRVQIVQDRQRTKGRTLTQLLTSPSCSLQVRPPPNFRGPLLQCAAKHRIPHTSALNLEQRLANDTTSSDRRFIFGLIGAALQRTIIAPYYFVQFPLEPNTIWKWYDMPDELDFQCVKEPRRALGSVNRILSSYRP